MKKISDLYMRHVDVSRSRRSFLKAATETGVFLGLYPHAIFSSPGYPILNSSGFASHSSFHQQASRVVEAGRRAHLFLNDDYLIETRENVRLIVGHAEKYNRNPVLTPDQPWEKGLMVYGCLLHDEEEQVYKIWYEVREDNFHSRCLYAHSADGLNWTKPILNQAEFEGSRKNNIVFPLYGGLKNKVYWVTKDYADADPAKRYKMIYHLWDHRGRGVSIAHSPDGLRWTASPYVNLHGGFDTQNIMFWDSRIGQYVGYFRHWSGGRRFIGRAVSPDGYHWSEPVSVHGPDARDPEKWDLYTPGIFKYSRAEDVYIMVTAAFDWQRNTLDGHLGLSRDGISWFRFRHSFLPKGQEGSWDHGSIYPIPSELVVGGKTAIYYRGNETGHGPGGRPGMGVAFLRKSGFAGWRADEIGTIITRPLRVQNAQKVFYLNADTGGNGLIRAELLDETNRVISGFTRHECQEIKGDGDLLLINWKGQQSLPSVIQDGPVKLKLYLQNAIVYGFDCQNPSSKGTAE